MKALNFFPALAQLLEHVVKIAAEVSDFVVAVREADRDVQVAFTYQRDFLLQFNHGPLNEIGEGADRHSTDGDRSGSGYDQNRVAVRVAQGYGCHNEQQQPRQEHEHYRQEGLELPIDAYRIQFELLYLPQRVKALSLRGIFGMRKGMP
jgi:hypothetical protein